MIFRVIAALLGAYCFSISAWADPLPSWNDGDTKRSIINFVKSVTDPANPNFVPPKERIATIDNDGTLWVEQPLYTQFIFAIERIKALAPQHPEWKTQKPFSYFVNANGLASLSKDDMDKNMHDVEQIFIATQTNMSVEDFLKIAREWLDTAKNPRFKHLYKEDVYQPMLEVMDYLRVNGFKVYIVTGGGQDFVRAYSESTYGVVPEQVIGTAGKLQYTYQNKKPVLIKKPELLFIDDHAGKPEGIGLFIGRKPIIAFGNSDGDQQMLEWTQSNTRPHLMLLVHHDDAVREYKYGPESKVGTFSNALMAEAKQNGWKIISMKNDWKVIFPFNRIDG